MYETVVSQVLDCATEPIEWPVFTHGYRQVALGTAWYANRAQAAGVVLPSLVGLLELINDIYDVAGEPTLAVESVLFPKASV